MAICEFGLSGYLIPENDGGSDPELGGPEVLFHR
jgi:hypothetical protein